MSEWQVLDLNGDPTPGDPGRIRELVGRLHQQTELIDRNVSRLRSVSADGGDLRMEGDYAPKFREVLSELPDELAKLGKAYRGCGTALSTFASSLEAAKAKSGTALRQGRDAHDQHQGALREIRSLLPPDRQATFATGLGPNDSLVEAAIADLNESVKAQVRIAARRARLAESDQDRARRLALEAARLRGEAENHCANGIKDALNDSGIKNKSWWRKAWDTVSKPFRSWDDFVKLCGTVAMVAGVVALFISGPIGWALMAAALVAGAVVFGDTLAKFASGKAGLGELAFSALGLIPGGRGVVSLAKLGRGLVGMARGLGSAGKLVGGSLRNLRGTFSAIRGGISNLRQSAVPVNLRRCVGDPIDVATGEMVLQQTDVELPGVLPLVLTRTHLSSYRVGRWFGPSWTSTMDQRLEVDATGVCYAAEDGTLLVYPTPIGAEPVWPEEGPRRPLVHSDSGYTITDPERGVVLHFATAADMTVLPLTAITDRNGHRVDLDYAPNGALAEIRHSGGYRIQVETTDELITALHLLGGNNGTHVTLVRYRYDKAHRLTEVINSSGLPLRFDYDADGRMTRWADRNGTEYRYTYDDDDGQCVRTSGSAGCLDGSFAYDRDNQVTVTTDSLGHVTQFHLNEAFQIVREVDPLGHTTVSEWDRYDRLLARTDPLGRTTRYTYDQAGNLVAVTRPDGSRATAAYNDLGLPVITTDPDGAAWQRAYDERGNLIAVADPLGAITSYAYDERGHLTAVTDALGHIRHVETNAAGLPIAVTDPLGAVTMYGRDAFGRVVSVTDPVGGIIRLGWTLEGKQSWRTLPDGATDRWTYDGEGNQIEHVDALGQLTHTEMTHFDLPAAQTGPDGARLAFSYDTELRLVAVANPQGLIWRYDYDPAGNLVRETDFNGRVLTYTHDPAGQLVARTNGAGQTTHYTHDLLGNIIEQRADDTAATFAYDPAGRLSRATNGDADVTFDRDPLGRVLAETCNGRTVISTYDILGRRTSRRTPSGAESAWEYDPNNQPLALHTAGQTLHFAYDPAGREVERRLGEGTVLAQTWDPNHQLLSQTLTAGGPLSSPPEPASGPLLGRPESASGPSPGRPESARDARLVQRRSYAYRPDGYVTSIDDHLSGTRRFDLDPTGRVTAVHGAGWTERYAYDPAGNITHAIWPSPPQAGILETEAQGEREYTGTLIRRAGNVRYRHDAQGRVTLRQQKRLSAKPRTWHYTWDADDRLVAVTTPDGQRWQYLYDPLGRRIAKQRLSEDNATVVEQVDFTWDGIVLAEQTRMHRSGDTVTSNQSSTLSWNYEPYTFIPVTQTELTSLRGAPQEWVDQRFYAIITDLIGTPTELVEANGNLVGDARAALWGVALSRLAGDVHCPLGFPGQYHDLEIGLHYNFYRYYNPEVARYVSSDPLGLDGGGDPHAYVPNPKQWLDPLGLVPCVKAVLKGENLPTRGKIRYVPPKDWHPSEPLRRGHLNGRRGFLDRHGNVWARGPSRTPGEHFEWDVQLARPRRFFGVNVGHLNISWSGEITHIPGAVRR